MTAVGVGTKLIILRGPSAAGKSTVAKRIIVKSNQRMAYLEEDYFRRVILQAKEDPATRREVCKRMLATNAPIALECGFDVIMEGMLSRRHYKPVIETLVNGHAGEAFLFHFDVSLEETIRRHRTKPIADEVTDHQLQEWFDAGGPLGVAHEKTIPESFTEEDSIAYIRQQTGL